MKIRSDIARAARIHGGAGVHKDRRLPRGGTKNLTRDWMDEYHEERDEEQVEMEHLHVVNCCFLCPLAGQDADGPKCFATEVNRTPADPKQVEGSYRDGTSPPATCPLRGDGVLLKVR